MTDFCLLRYLIPSVLPFILFPRIKRLQYQNPQLSAGMFVAFSFAAPEFFPSKKLQIKEI